MENFHAYIDANSQILIDEYLGDEVQSTTKFQYQCKNMEFYDSQHLCIASNIVMG